MPTKEAEAAARETQIISAVLNDISVKGRESLDLMLNAMNRLKALEAFIKAHWKEVTVEDVTVEPAPEEPVAD